MVEMDRGLGSGRVLSQLLLLLLLPALPLLVIAGCATGKKLVWDGPKRDRLQSDTAVLAVRFSPDSRYLAHLDQEGTVHIWSVLQDKSAGERKFTEFQANSLAMGALDRFAVAGPDGVRVFTVGGGEVADFKIAATATFMLFDESGSNLAVADDGGRVTVYDLQTKKPLRAFTVPQGAREWQLLPGARFGVMYLLPNGSIRTVSCGLPRSDVTVEFERSGPVSITPDGKTIAIVNHAGKVEIRSLPDGQLRTTLASLSPTPGRIDLSADGSVLAVGVPGTGVSLWDIQKDELLETFNSDISDAEISFSPDSNLLAWTEQGLNTVRFWSPGRGVVQWTPTGSVVRGDAQGVCSSYADIVRFRLAMTPFARGLDQLRKRDLEKALRSFANVRRVFPRYPGLDLAEAEAQERHQARLLGRRVELTEGSGDYHASLELLDGFLKQHAKFDDYGFTKRADTLRRMLTHFDKAVEHAKAARDIDAVIEFRLAAVIVPELKRYHPKYPELDKKLLRTLSADAEAAYGAKDFERVIILYGDLARLRPLVGGSLLRLGEAHKQLGHGKEAEEVYLTVADNAAEYVDARRSVAAMAREAGDYPKARKHLHLARSKAPELVEVAVEYAETCQLCEDHDAAVKVWEEVGQLEPTNPKPYEMIASIEEERKSWSKAADALRTAVNRSDKPRPRLLVKMASVYLQSEERREVLGVYLELIKLAKSDPETLAFLGASPRQKVENWIRKLSFVRHGREWITREQFFEAQGWERYEGEWLRPKEVRLREVVKRYNNTANVELRGLSDQRYLVYVKARRITKGMNRREVIRAWGFFNDQNLSFGVEGKDLFEQLLFDRSRKVYLKNGLVCHWSE